ncbi:MULTISPECIES: cbb3-type cytochrome oxidase assembly protein CcoS [unclassified Thiocapsa]|uniref:cbb3-type cytochrome oxidase assembly protein CcoS n=1 Tax=unclassified Thiocapsa TaxID=2641286 RepID=UPI0035AD7CCB
MDVIYGLIPGMLVLGLAAVAVLFWATRTGQYDDMDGDGRRILMDEDEEDGDPRRAPAMDADPELNPVESDPQGKMSHRRHTD